MVSQAKNMDEFTLGRPIVRQGKFYASAHHTIGFRRFVLRCRVGHSRDCSVQSGDSNAAGDVGQDPTKCIAKPSAGGSERPYLRHALIDRVATAAKIGCVAALAPDVGLGTVQLDAKHDIANLMIVSNCSACAPTADAEIRENIWLTTFRSASMITMSAAAPAVAALNTNVEPCPIVDGGDHRRRRCLVDRRPHGHVGGRNRPNRGERNKRNASPVARGLGGPSYRGGMHGLGVAWLNAERGGVPAPRAPTILSSNRLSDF